MPRMSSKSLKDLKVIIAVGYAAGIFVFLFCAWLYFSSFLTGPVSEFTNAIVLALVFTAIVFLVYNVHLHRKLKKGEIKSKRVSYLGPSPLIATLLALFPGILGFLGLGHFYIGKKMRGICYLIFGISAMVFIYAHPSAFPPFIVPIDYVVVRIMLAIAWVWQIVDVYKLARA